MKSTGSSTLSSWSSRCPSSFWYLPDGSRHFEAGATAKNGISVISDWPYSCPLMTGEYLGSAGRRGKSYLTAAFLRLCTRKHSRSHNPGPDLVTSNVHVEAVAYKKVS